MIAPENLLNIVATEAVEGEGTPMTFAYVARTPEEQAAEAQAARDTAIAALGAVYPPERPALFALFCGACGAMKESAEASCQWCPVLPATCTGLTARWCPVHGACVCDDEGMDSEHCPLHRTSSAHAEEPLQTPDPNEGWIPLAEGCAMPESGSTPLVTLLDGDGKSTTVSALYLPHSFTVGPMVYIGPGFDTFYNAGRFDGIKRGARVTAWRPAPAPWRGNA